MWILEDEDTLGASVTDPGLTMAIEDTVHDLENCDTLGWSQYVILHRFYCG